MSMYQTTSKRLPFKKDMPLPQRLKFVHNNEIYEITYRRNSFDNFIHIKLRRVLTDELLLTARLVNGGIHIVRRSENGVTDFILVVVNVGKDNVDIRLIDDDYQVAEIG